MLRISSQLLKNVAKRASNIGSIRCMTHYPIDDVMFGLTEEQSAVRKIFTIILREKKKLIRKFYFIVTSNCFQFCSKGVGSICTRD